MLDSFKSWLAAPFSDNMSATKWFAFVGLLLAIMMVWGIILRHLRDI